MFTFYMYWYDGYFALKLKSGIYYKFDHLTWSSVVTSLTGDRPLLL